MNNQFETSDASIALLASVDASRALEEDLGTGDITAALVEPSQRSQAQVLARETAVICGQLWVEATLKQLDAQAELVWHVRDGETCRANQLILEIQGNSRALLSGERTLLNFLQLLSAVSTQTAAYVRTVEAVAGNRARIVDTRKTIPGLRLAQKYAVRCGGGINHRIGLYDAILIKENHIAAAGGITAVLQRTAKVATRATFVEIEVENLVQLEEAIAAGAQMILLDNMGLVQLRKAVGLTAGRAILEVSGGVGLDTVADIAATGVDRISIGALTKNIKAIDFSMRFKPL